MRFRAQKFLVSLCVLAGVLSAADGAFGQALNLSRDLVANGIATSNMTPDLPSLDSRPLFQAGVAYAAAHHIPTVVADRGRYYFLSLNSPYQHVYLSGITNVTVDLRHSDLYFAQSNIVALHIVNSTNVTLENFTVDYLQLPFTQVTVTGVRGTTVSVQPLGAYPLPSTFNSRTMPTGYNVRGYFLFVFRNGQQLRTTGRMEAQAPFNDRAVHLTGTEPWVTSASLASIQPGDTMVLTWRAGLATIFIGQSTGFTLHGVSIYASGFLGVLVRLSSGTTIDHVQVIPRPGTDRLISTNADGIHLSKAGANNVVSNNTVRRGCDDGIAIDGQWYAIVNAPNRGHTVQVRRNNTGTLAINGAFEFISIVDATIVGTATILAEDPPVDQQTGQPGELITLTLDHPVRGLQPGFGVTPADPNLRGAGTVISGNLVQEEVFARGIYPVGVKNVRVTDNMTQATNQAGILVEQDEGLTYSYKTGPSSGLVIKHNIVDQALGYGVPSNPVLGFTASINVVAYDEHFNWVTTQSLSNISVTGNFVTNSAHSGIRMENVNGGTVSDNIVANAGTQPRDYLWFRPAGETVAQLESELAKPILVVNSRSVTDTGNTTHAAPVTNTSLADGGYRLAPNSIVVARGQPFTRGTGTAKGPALPQKLAGLEVTVKDSAGVSRRAALYAAGPSQVTYVMPPGTAAGVATVTVGTQVSGALISSVAPGLFSADGTGRGVALATAERSTAGGQQKMSEAVYTCSSTCVAVPLDLGQASETLLVSFQGTGIRGHSSLANVVADIAGIPARVEQAGTLPNADPGMDYVTVKIPPSLAGAGEVPVVLTVDGFTANVVMISIK